MNREKIITIGIILGISLFLVSGCLGGEQENTTQGDMQEDTEEENESEPGNVTGEETATVNKTASEKTKAKYSASNCAQALAAAGKEPGTPNETVCGEICSYVEGKDFPVTQEAMDNGVTTAYEVCLAGKSSWIE